MNALTDAAVKNLRLPISLPDFPGQIKRVSAAKINHYVIA
jgi:hypothetical protein